MTKKEFENSKDPYVFFVSIDPETGEKNWEYLEGYQFSWMKNLIERDFPERFSFGKLNEAAVNLRAKELFNFGSHEEMPRLSAKKRK